MRLAAFVAVFTSGGGGAVAFFEFPETWDVRGTRHLRFFNFQSIVLQIQKSSMRSMRLPRALFSLCIRTESFRGANSFRGASVCQQLSGLFVVVAMLVTSSAGAAERPWETALDAEQLASRQRIAGDLEYISSDALGGRDTGSEEIEVAANYIANRFRSLGMNTELFDGTAFQRFVAFSETKAGSAEENFLVVKPVQGDREFRYELDKAVRPLSLGIAGEVTAPLVFVGYGISAPDKQYDDYAGLDVKGKIVVMLRGEPRRGRDDNPLGGRGSSRYAFFTTKVATAIEKGAAAVLLVNTPEVADQMLKSLEGQLASQKAQVVELTQAISELPEDATNVRMQLEQKLKLAETQMTALTSEIESTPMQALMSTNTSGQNGEPGAIPVVSFGRQAFDELLSAFGAAEGDSVRTLADIEKGIDADFVPQSFVLEGCEGHLKAGITSRDVVGINVVGELPGAGDLANQTVVIGAHYDHVGMGGAGSLAPGTIAIHNGADDNGSGTCMLLEVAHRLARDQSPNRRRFVFICFSGEEKGLLGSKHYAREPRFALEDTVGMINLDMVGRLNEDEQLTVFGTGSAPEFDELVDQWNEKYQLPLRKDPSGYGPSDHTSFYEKQVPVLFFFTGLHSDYHRPSDDFDKINLDGMVRITDIVCDAARHLATVAERPKYQTTGPGEGVRPRRQPAYLGVALESADGAVVVGQVVSEGPAANAGIQAGDKIVRIGDIEARDVAQVQDAVSRMRPGRKVSVVLLRGGDEITVSVNLGQRP